MFRSIVSLIMVWSSWIFALIFIRMEKKRILWQGAALALLCGILGLCTPYIGRSDYLFLMESGLLALAAVVAMLFMEERAGNAAFTFLLAQGGNAVLSFPVLYALPSAAILAAALSGIALAAFWGAVFCLRKRLPPTDWQACFHDTAQETGRLHLRLEQIYGVTAVACCLLSAGALLLRPDSIAEALLGTALSFTAFWALLCLFLLMITYQREQTTALAERQYRDEMQSFMNVIRSQRHDYNFHVNTIAGLIQDGKIEECKKYVKALEKDSELINAILPVKDPAISATILNFQTLAAREGIVLHIDIQNDLAQIATNVYETNKIISNLLQNAIDEVSGHRDKSYGIRLDILKRNEYCVIRVSNEVESKTVTAEDLGQFYRQGYTTKQGHDGVGLCGIRALAGRYRGMVFTQVDGKVLHFIAKIPINYAKETDL